MGLGSRKLLGVSLNLSKGGPGVSVGRRGASASVSSTGRRQLSLSGRGLFWRKRL